MSALSPDCLADAYREACALDVQAFKPGNVSVRSPGHGMSADDFLHSAESSATPISQAGLPLGMRIRQAVEASYRRVGCNTNLGIVLLVAPLIQACLDYPELAIRDGVEQILNESGVDDAAAVYAAIRMVSPGGLGRIDSHDVADDAQLPLVDVMREASDRDFIARQYSNGFTDLFDIVLPALTVELRQTPDPAVALTGLFLYLLARYPDSHIQRKHGALAARRVSRMARKTLQQMDRSDDPLEQDRLLASLDGELKRNTLNPGTSADLCVAGFLIHHLQQQAVIPTGATRKTSRSGMSKRADTPQTAICQLTDEEIQNGCS